MRRPQTAGRQGSTRSERGTAAANSAETAAYIASAAAGLAKLASAARFTTLTYLLNMAQFEAEEQLSKLSPPPN
jgi:hypothetical protein